MRVKWLKWLLKPLFLILAIPSLGCGGLLALLLALSLIDSLPSNVVRRAREQGGLAQLPPSATELKTDGGSSFLSSNHYLRFKAEPKEIETFISTSPGLQRIKPERFNPRHMHLPYPRKTEFNDEQELEEHGRHEYFSLRGLDWYNPTIRVKGRRYEIPWHGQGYHGEVIIDDVNHVVFIHTAYS